MSPKIPSTPDHACILIRHLSERSFELTAQEYKRHQLVIKQKQQVLDLDSDAVDYQSQKTFLMQKQAKKTECRMFVVENRWLLLLHKHKQELEVNGLPVPDELQTLPSLHNSVLCGATVTSC
ncbi:hypothetical protein [Dyadobacter bucti]|jgi:hypothetical protein|uniref:hypothetical protein n=1 Tax=Dyadobacter bucti TaxID=2572203 RepID=UPI001107AFF9|nr:hypothetical protein [Dyadobacter bucti]